MADLSFLATPVTLFLVGLGIAFLLYLWGGVLAPRSQLTGHKGEMYTGGEAPKEQQVQPSYGFYHIALFFTLLHVAVLVMVTAPSGPGAWIALLYLSIISIAVAALIWR